MNIYDIIYYSIYRKVKLIDKELPEWSTIFVLSGIFVLTTIFPLIFFVFPSAIKYI